MSPITGNSEFGRDLCRALGMEGKRVTGVTLKVPANDVVVVIIERNLIDQEAGEILTLIKKYNLVESTE